MRAALYARVSSQVQRDRHTIASQLRVLPEFARGRGWELVESYVDDGRTAKAGHLAARAGLAKMLRDAAARKFDILVVIDIDRLTRSEDLTERGQILGGLQRAGVKVAVATTGQILDFNESTGDLYGSLQAFFAAEWGRKHRARIVEGKLTAIKNGKKPAGPTPFGFRYDRQTGVWSIYEPEAEIVREIFERCMRGETGKAIADDLEVRGVPRPHGGRWQRERVYQTLRQTAYNGTWIADKERKLTITTPRIVTETVWQAVRDRERSQARKLKGLRRTKHVYLLEGLAVCALCGSRIGIVSATPGRRPGVVNPSKYACSRRRREDGGESCLLPYLATAEVDERLWRAIRELVLVPGRIERAAKAAQTSASTDSELWRADLVAAEKRLSHLARHVELVMARGRRGLLTGAQVDKELELTKREREMAEEQLNSARRAAAAAGKRSTRAAGVSALVAQLRSRVDATTVAERRALATALFEPGAVRLSIATIEANATARVVAGPSLGLVSEAG